MGLDDWSVSRKVVRCILRTALALGALGLILVGLGGGRAEATSGQINNVMNLQGRLLTASGAVVADGTYNIEFKIYKNGDGQSANNSTGSPASTLLWTEDWLVHNSQGVTVKNGYFSVQLGTISSLPSATTMDESVLFLSMNVAGGANATANCNPFSSCTPDGEMLPMRSLAAAPYAMNAANANALGGIAASGFIQNSASVQQTASFDIVAGAVGDAGGQIQAASSGTAAVLVLKNGSGSSGDLLQLQPSGSTTPLTRFDSSGNLYVAGSVDTQSSATLSIAGTTATTINIGATGASTNADTIHIADSTGAAETLTVGSTNGASATTIQAGTGNLTFKTNSSSASIVAKTQTNSATGFQIQDASSINLLNVDTTANAANLVSDGSFETNPATAGWAVMPTNSSFNGTNGQVSSPKMFGNYGMSVHITGTSGGTKYPVVLTASTTYNLNFWSYGSATGNNSFGYGYSSDGSTNTTCSTGNFVTGGWTRYTCQFTTAGTVNGGAYLFFFEASGATSRDMYLDGVELELTGNSIYAPYQESRAQLNGIISSPLFVQPAADAVGAFQVFDANGDSALSVDTVNNRVGIGTPTTPLAVLDVSRSSGSNAGIPLVRFNQSGSAGDILDILGSTPAAVAGTGTTPGAALSVVAQTGGATSGTTGQVGGAGSLITLQTGAGGAATGASGTETAGAGGAFSVTTGAGGAATSGIGGAGGNITFMAGNGGAGSGTNANGNGGSITLAPGAAGSGGSGGGSAGQVLVKGAGNSTSAFQVQNASGAQIVNVDTTNGTLTVQGTTADNSLNALYVNDTNGNPMEQIRNDGYVYLGKNTSGSPTLGKTNIGGTGDSGYTNLVTADKVTTGAASVTVNSISFYDNSSDSSPNNKYIVGIYTDSSGSPNSLVASSAQGTLTTGSWNTIAISASLAANTTYWLSFSTNTTSSSIHFVPYDSVGTSNHKWMNVSSGVAGVSNPSTFTVNGSSNTQHSEYANVTETGYLATSLILDPTNGATVATPTNSTTGFLVQNASSNAVLTVDTSNNKVILGKANTSGDGGKLVFSDANSVNSGTLQLGGTLSGNVTYNLPTAGGNLCTDVTSTCGGSYIINGTSTQTGNFNIQSASAASVGAVIQGAASQTGDLLETRDSNGNVLDSLDPSGNLQVTGLGGLGKFMNLLNYSEAFDNALWTKTTATATADQTTAPDSTTSADTVHATSSGGNLKQSYASAGNNTYTFSVWLKTAASTQNVDLRIDSNGTPATGTGKTVTATTTWQRFFVTQTFTSGVSSITPTLFPGTAGGTDSQTVYAWGAQLVQDSVPENYIRSAGGNLPINVSGQTGQGLVLNAQATSIPLMIQQQASQSAWLMQIDSSTDVRVAGFDNSGNIVTNGQVESVDRVCNNCVSSTVTVTSGNSTGTGNSDSGNVSITTGSSTRNVGNITVQPGAATAGNTGTVGSVTIQGGSTAIATSTGGGVTIQGGTATGATSATGGTVSIQGGTATTGTTTTGGNVSIDAGTGTTANGTVSIGTSNATGVTLGKSGSTFTVNSATTFNNTAYINTNSTAALKVEQNGVHNNVLTVDTTNGSVSIDTTPVSGIALNVLGLTQTSALLLTSSPTSNYLAKQYQVGTGGVTASDVLVLVNDGGNSRVVDTTTARDTRVMGVAIATQASGNTETVAIGGNYQVTADTGAVAIGDQLVTSTTSGQVTVDNNATTGILGYATSAKSGGSSGLVGVYIHPTNGQYTPTFRPNSNSTAAMQLQNAAGTSYLTADSTNQIVTTKDVNVGSAGNTTGGFRLFSDGFESGDFRFWPNKTTGTGTTITADTSTVRNGKYSAKIDLAGAPGTLQTAINGGSTVDVRGYVYVASNTAGNDGLFWLCNNNCSNEFLLYRDNATGKLGFYNNGTFNVGSTVLTAGAWHEIELNLTINSSTGSDTVYLDGTSVLSQTSQNTGSSNPTKLYMGDINGGTTDTVYFDDVVVDSVRPGDSSSLSVNDSLHVGGTSSFGGQMAIQATYDSQPALTLLNSDGTTGLEVRSGGSGGQDTFIGLSAGVANTINTGSNYGVWNTGVGYQSLQANTQGHANTGAGWGTLNANTTGNNNTALGLAALWKNTTSSDNTALGYGAMENSLTGGDNTAVGSQALYNANGAQYNTGVGFGALYNIGAGSGNTGFGYVSGANITSGQDNTFIGYQSGYQDSNDGFVTTGALQNATALGYNAQVQSSNSLVLGGSGAADNVNVGIGTTIPLDILSVSPFDYGTGTAAVSSPGTTVTGSGTLWRSNMVGEQFVFSNGQTGIITAVSSQTSLTLDTSQPTTTATSYRIHQIGLNVTSAANMGLGTYSPSAKLQVAGNSTDSVLFQANSSSGGVVGQFVANGDVNLGGAQTANTVGKTTAGSSNASGYGGVISAQKITTTTGGTVTSASTTLINIDTTPSEVQFGIYADSSGYPGSLIATSPAVRATKTGTITVPITATLSPSTVYWISYWTNSGSSNNNTYDTGAPANNWYFISQAWACTSSCTNGMPNTFPAAASGGAYTFNEWLTFEPASAVRVTGSNGASTFQNTSNSTGAFQIQNAAGTSNLFVADTTNSKIGVGTNSPNSYNGKLVVYNSGYGFSHTDGTIQLSTWLGTARGNTGGMIGTDSNNPLQFYTNGTSNMVLLANGNVNIGQDNAGNLNANSATLQVRGSGASNSLFKVTDTTGADFDVLNIADEGATTFKNRTDSTAAFQIQNAAGTSFLTANSANQIVTTKDLNAGSAGNISGAGRILSDGFESGSFSQYTTTSGSATIDTATVRNGKYAAKFQPSGSAAYVRTPISGSSTMVLRGYVYITSQTTGLERLMELCTDSACSTNHEFALYRDDTNGKLGLLVGNGSTASAVDGSTVISTGAWHEIEMDITINSSTGSGDIYLDGTSVYSFSSGDTGSVNPSYLNIGESASGRTSVANIDDVTLDTVRPGDSSSLNVNDSLHVGGSSSFGSNILVQTAGNSTTAFQVQNSASAGILTVDTTNAKVTVATTAAGGQLTNNGATLNSAKNLGNFASNGAIGTAAATVDVYTTFVIPQTTASISLTVPNPTDTTAGRQIYIANTGSTSLTVAGITLSNGSSMNLFWNGSAWTTTAVSTGVSIVGAFSGSSQTNGASISGNTITFGPADTTNPGMVSTGTQTFAGAKTFKTTTNSASGFAIQNAAGVSFMNVDTTAGSTNLVSNGSFETDTAGTLPSGWSNKGSATDTASTGQYVFGKQSMDASTTAAANDGTKYNITLSDNTAYSLTFYASGSAAFSTFNYGYSSDGTTEDAANISATGQTLPAVGTSGWSRFNLSFTTPASHSGTPYLYFKQSDATARHIYLDGVDLEQTTGQAYYKDASMQLNGPITGPLVVQNTANNNSTFAVNDMNGTRVFTVDSRNFRIGVNTVNPSADFSFGATTAGGGTRTINITAAASGSSGDTLALQANNGNGTNKNGGALTLTSGNATGSGTGGAISLTTGTSATGTTGAIQLTTGNASGAGTAGSITLTTGSTASGTAGQVLIQPASGGDSTTAFQVKKSDNTQIFTVDTTNNRVVVGSGSSQAKFYVVGSAQTGLRVNTTTSGDIMDLQNASGATVASALFEGSLSLAANPSLTGAGTVTSNATTAIVGTSTTFTTSQKVGDVLTISGDTCTIASITDATHLTCEASVPSHSGVSYTYVQAVTGSGTVTNSASGTTLSGTTTNFLSAVKAGDVIVISTDGQTCTVSAVSSNTSLTCTAGITSAHTNVAYTFTGSGSTDSIQLDANGQVGIGTSAASALSNALTVGGSALFKNASNSTSAFSIQNSAGTSNLFIADTTDTKIGIGAAVNNNDSAMLQVAGGISLGKRTDSGGTTSDWTLDSGSAGSPCASAATSVDTVKSSVVYNGSLYVGTSEQDKAEVCRYDGGTTFTRMNSAAGTFGSQTNVDTVASMSVYNGYLYIGTTGGGASTGADTNNAAVYRWDGSTTFTLINTTIGKLQTTTGIDSITAMAVYQGHLYVGTSETGTNQAELYWYNGGTGASVFERVNGTAGTFDTATGIPTVSGLIVFNNELYISLNDTNGAQLIRYDGDYGCNCMTVASPSGSFDVDPANTEDEIDAMAVYNGRLYLAVAETGTGNAARIFSFSTSDAHSNDGYYQLNTTAGTLASGSDCPSSTCASNIDRVTAMTVYNGNLYVGTKESNSGEVYEYKGNGAAGASVFTKISQATAGTIKASGTANIDGIGTMIPFNDSLFVGTDESNSAEVYSFSQVEGQSQRLFFNASSDNAGSTEQAAYPNQGSIFFAAEQNGTSNPQGAMTGSFIFSNGINTASGAYDVAEDYPTRDYTLKPGDLVAIDPHETGFVRKASGPYDPGIVGVYSENPALRLTQADATINGGRAIPVALAGRVPISVSTENGAILPGDPLTSSSTAGVAMKATGSGRIVGMAMEPYDGQGVGKVMGFVNPNYYSGVSGVQGSAQSADLAIDGKISAKDVAVTGTVRTQDLNVTGTATLAALNVTGAATVGSLTVLDGLTTKSLDVTSEAMINILTAGAVTVNGDVNVGGDLHLGKAQSKNAITKEFTAGQDLTAGEVVVADPAHDGQVTTTKAAGDTKVVGVVLADAKSGAAVKVAIGGTVQVKTSGTVVPGDILATSTTEGAAAKQDPPQVGAIVGKALSKPDASGLVWLLVVLQ